MNLKQYIRDKYDKLNRMCERFSLTGYEKRNYKKYIATRNYYEQFHGQELRFRYSNAKVEYEHKRNMLSLLLVSLSFAVMYSPWKGLFSFSLSAVKSHLTSAAIRKDILVVSLGLMFGGALLVSFLIFSVIHCYRYCQDLCAKLFAGSG